MGRWEAGAAGLLFGMSWSLAASAQQTTTVDASTLEPIVVTAKKQTQHVPDEQLKHDVERAFESDRFFYGEHVTVRTHNGVVYLEGLVWEEGGMRQALRIARKTPGVRRVVNELELTTVGSD